MSEEDVHARFAKRRWGMHGDGKQVCPSCGCIDSHYVIHRRHQWRCKVAGCGRTFSVTSGTKLQDHKIPLKQILRIMLTYVVRSGGINAMYIKDTEGLAYQTAFTLLHKLREGLLDDRNLAQLERHVEVDGGHFSGRIRKPRKKIKTTGLPARAKLGKKWFATHPNRRIVVVLREISPTKLQGAVRTIVAVVKAENEACVTPVVYRYVKQGSEIQTDESNAFCRLAMRFEHRTVNHSVEFSTDDGVNDNQAESFYSRCRRLNWEVRRITPKYMLDYMNEMAWREDRRRDSFEERIDSLLDGVMKHGLSKWWRGYWQGHHRAGELIFDAQAPSGFVVA